VLLWFTLDYKHGTATGAMRLSPLGARSGSAEDLATVDAWQVYTVSMSIDTVHGWDAENGDQMRNSKGRVQDPLHLGRNYNDVRQTEMEDPQPSVLIVGGGNCGLAMAARCKVLGIPHLIIERSHAPGSAWESRYASLTLHGPTFTNFMPCLPYPNWFPTFIPAQQLSKFMQAYTAIMDLNVWVNSTAKTQSATYDNTSGRWTVDIDRNGSPYRLHPKNVIICTGISGSQPKLPEIPGMVSTTCCLSACMTRTAQDTFKRAGGIAVHSSVHKTTSEWHAKRVLVVGAGASSGSSTP
jgi:putative flavoprotein involved in K+ transport